MEEKKAKIILEEVDNDTHCLVMEGNVIRLAHLIAQNYVGELAFRDAVNLAMRRIMEMGVDLLERQQAKDMRDGD